jgi:hypothetical protein
MLDVVPRGADDDELAARGRFVAPRLNRRIDAPCLEGGKEQRRLSFENGHVTARDEYDVAHRVASARIVHVCRMQSAEEIRIGQRIGRDRERFVPTGEVLGEPRDHLV